MNKLVSIIIVNWNGKEHLQKCLPLLFAQSYKKIEVILVDNASTDDSIGYVKQKFPQVKIIINKKNLGFAGGNNAGYRFIRGEYVLFLNNDTKVTSSFLSHLVVAIESEKSIGGVGGKMLLMDNPKFIDSVGSFFTTTGFLYHYGAYKRDGEKYNSQIELYSARGACMMFKRSVLEEIKVEGGIFDDSYFAYFEETDLCHRVWLAGYKIIFVPKSIIYHKLGATSEKLANSFVHYHSYKNRICSYVKNLGISNLVKVLPLHIFLCLAVSILYFVRGNMKVTWAIVRAIAWNCIFLRETIKKRAYIQDHIRKLDDRQFLPALSITASLKYYYYVFFADLKNYADEKNF